MYRTVNPAITGLSKYADFNQEASTVKGVALKGVYFIAITILSAVISAFMLNRYPGVAVGMIVAGAITAFISCLVASFAPKTTAVSGTLYAIGEGLVVGAVSAVMSAAYSGVVLAALISTFVVFGIMMILYATGVIRVGHKFRSFMFSALLGVVISQFLFLIVGLIFPSVWAMFYGNWALQVGISVLMVALASFYILCDLSNISAVIDAGLPKQYEWRAAFGLCVTLIWLYIEFLRLFALIASRKD